MSELRLIGPVELGDADLDAVSAGLAAGLVALNIGVGNVLSNDLNNIKISALNGNTVTLTDIASGNTVTTGVGVVVALLSGATGVLNKFA